MSVLGMSLRSLTWTTRRPMVPGWYWTRWKREGDPSAYSYDVIRVEERWPGAELVDADDQFTVSLDHDSYDNHEWSGLLEPAGAPIFLREPSFIAGKVRTASSIQSLSYCRCAKAFPYTQQGMPILRCEPAPRGSYVIQR